MVSGGSVSVIVVSYNTREQTRRCLSCIEPEHEVIVVDNASTDGSCEMVREEFPRVRLISNDTNRGFGPANNQGLAVATHRLALLLNSDVYAQPGSIGRLAETFDEARWGAVVACGGRLLHPDGSVQLSAANRLSLWVVFCEQTLLEKLLPRSRWLSPYWVGAGAEHSTPVAQVMGACLMMRREARFDERFPLYCEDTDLCARLAGRGVILYVPEASFVHELGASSSGERWRSVALYNRGKELYFRIHHGPAAMAACWVLNRAGAMLRMLGWSAIAVARPDARRQAALFRRVLTAPFRGPGLAQRGRET